MDLRKILQVKQKNKKTPTHSPADLVTPCFHDSSQTISDEGTINVEIVLGFI